MNRDSFILDITAMGQRILFLPFLRGLEYKEKRSYSGSQLVSVTLGSDLRMCACSALTLCDLRPARRLCPRDSPGKNTRMGCHSLFQGIFPTQGPNPQLLQPLHWRAAWEARIQTYVFPISKAHTLY